MCKRYHRYLIGIFLIHTTFVNAMDSPGNGGKAVRSNTTRSMDAYRLYASAKAGKLNDIIKLSSQGIDLNAPITPDGCNVMHIATKFGRLHVLKWLVDQGYDLHKTTPQGFNVLYFAALEGHQNLIEWLISKHGFDINAMFNGTDSILNAVVAGERGSVALVISILRERKFDTSRLNPVYWEKLIRQAYLRNYMEIGNFLRELLRNESGKILLPHLPAPMAGQSSLVGHSGGEMPLRIPPLLGGYWGLSHGRGCKAVLHRPSKAASIRFEFFFYGV